jgi:hypothetical protein
MEVNCASAADLTAPVDPSCPAKPLDCYRSSPCQSTLKRSPDFEMEDQSPERQMRALCWLITGLVDEHGPTFSSV